VEVDANEVEAHLLKETAAAAAAAGAIIAGTGSAQARIFEPDPGNQTPAAQTQSAGAHPVKKAHKKADNHKRQRNRADTLDS